MQTLGLLKQFAVESLHEDVLDVRLADLLVPRWATQTIHRINAYTRWRWNEASTQLNWPANGILYLPDEIDYPLSVYPQAAVSYLGTIDIIDATKFDRGRPTFTTDGTIRLVVYGDYGVELDNPIAGNILTTGVAADVGMELLIEGFSVAGRPQREIVVVGAPGTILSALAYAAGVEGVRKVTIVTASTAVLAAAAPNLPLWWGFGDVVISSGGVAIATINSNFQNNVRCKRTELYGAAGLFDVRYSRRHRPLVRDTDILEVPQEFEEVVELGIQEKLSLFKENPEKAQAFRGMFNSRMKELLAWDKRQPARTKVPGILER